MNELVCFELNHWIPGVGYPNEEPFITWMKDDTLYSYFVNEEWVKKNKLCVFVEIIDMSINFHITAPKEWVKEKCPKLLTCYTSFLREVEQYTPGKIYFI